MSIPFLISYMAIPILAAVAVFCCNLVVPSTAWQSAIAVTAFVSAALVALLVRLHTDKRQVKDANPADQTTDPVEHGRHQRVIFLRGKLIEAVFYNISVALFLGLLVILLSFLALVFGGNISVAISNEISPFLSALLTSVCVFFLANYGITIYLIVKRVLILFSSDFKPAQ